MRYVQLPTVAIMACVALFITLLSMAPTQTLENENWPSFRGGDARSVVSDDERLPTTWSATENVAWKAAVDGLGWSSPVVWGDRIFVTSVVSTGDIEEPRMGLYFPYGTPRAAPGYPQPKDGERMDRSADVHHWVVYAIDFDTGRVEW